LKISPVGIGIAGLDQLQKKFEIFISTISILEEKTFGKKVGMDFGKDILKS
jgi:hypothetical protein